MSEINTLLDRTKKKYKAGNNKEVNKLLKTLLKKSLTDTVKDEVNKLKDSIQLDNHAVILGCIAAFIALIIVVFILT